MQNKNTIKICYSIAFLVALAPTILRFMLGNPFPAGTYSYHFMLNYNLNYLNIISILTSLASIYFIYLCSKRYLKEDSNLFVLLLIMSIPFIYLFNNFTVHNIIVLVISISTYLYTSEELWKIILGLILFLSLTPLSQGRVALVIVFFLLALYTQGIVFVNYILVILSSISIFLFDIGLFPSTAPFFKIYLAELGAEIGFGASFLLLALFGFVLSWGRKAKLYPLYIASIILTYFAYKFEFFIIYLNFILVFYSLITLKILVMKKWHFTDLKKTTIIILVISFLFSGMVYATNFATASPTTIDIKNYEELKNYPYGIVLTHQSNSYWVEHYANQDYFADPLDLNSLEISHQIFQTKFLANATKLLEENQIRYILITKEMRSGQVWSKADQGLLFTLPNRQHFRRIYNEDDMEIYEVLAHE